MIGLTQYLLESTICMAIFYLCFYWFFKKSSFHQWNRWYLLLTPWIALILPGIELEFSLTTDYSHGQVPDFDLAFIEQIEEKAPPFSLTLNALIKLIYISGVAFFGFRFIDKYWKFKELFTKKRNQSFLKNAFPSPYSDYPLTALFSLAYWGPTPLTRETKELLIEHRQDFGWLNSLDVFFTEILKIGLWFHPIIYLFKRDLNGVHKKIHNQFTNSSKSGERYSFIAGIKTVVVISLILLFFYIFSYNSSNQIPWLNSLPNIANSIEAFGELSIYKYQKPKDPEFAFHWGNIHVPLEKVAAPNAFSGELEIELNRLFESLDSNIRVYENQDSLSFKNLTIHLNQLSKDRPVWFPQVSPNNFDFEHRYLGNMKSKIEEGDQISISGEVGNIYLAGINLNIKDPKEIYSPIIKVPNIKKESKTYGFQIVSLPGRKSIVRIDKTQKSSQKILDIYSDNSKYDIIHIPNFATDRRLITTENILFPDIKYDNLIIDDSIQWFELPEYQNYRTKMVKLFWGKMVAAPSSQNFTQTNFKQNYRNKLDLFIGNEHVKIEKLKTSIVPKAGEPLGFITKNLDPLTLRRALGKCMPRTSIYFEDIVVNHQGRFFQLPISFVFNIGTPKDVYEVNITESQAGVAQKTIREPGFLYYQNYSLPELINILTDQERMVFGDDIKVPQLDLYFRSENLSTKRGERILLKKLKAQFHFKTEIRYENRKVYILKSDKNNALIQPFEYVEENRISPEENLHANWEMGLESFSNGYMDDLANLIEYRFDIIVFNETELQKPFSLGLNMTSLATLQFQLLNDFGVELVEEERVVKIVKAVLEK